MRQFLPPPGLLAFQIIFLILGFLLIRLISDMESLVPEGLSIAFEVAILSFAFFQIEASRERRKQKELIKAIIQSFSNDMEAIATAVNDRYPSYAELASMGNEHLICETKRILRENDGLTSVPVISQIISRNAMDRKEVLEVFSHGVALWMPHRLSLWAEIIKGNETFISWIDDTTLLSQLFYSQQLDRLHLLCQR